MSSFVESTHAAVRPLRLLSSAIALAFVAVSCGSAAPPDVTLIGVGEQRSQEALEALRVEYDCENPEQVKKVEQDQYEVTCVKDGFIFDAKRTHTVFCADGEWQIVGYTDVGAAGIKCSSESG